MTAFVARYSKTYGECGTVHYVTDILAENINDALMTFNREFKGCSLTKMSCSK